LSSSATLSQSLHDSSTASASASQSLSSSSSQSLSLSSPPSAFSKSLFFSLYPPA
jgi:hypothetical protein